MATKTFRVVWTEAATRDYESTLEYVAVEDGIERALQLDDKLDGRIVSLKRYPNRGRIVPELRAEGIDAFRELIEKPYRIVFRVHGRDVVLLAVVDGRRDLHELLLERVMRLEGPASRQ